MLGKQRELKGQGGPGTVSAAYAKGERREDADVTHSLYSLRFRSFVHLQISTQAC